MFSVRLPRELEERIAILAKTTGRTKAFYLCQALRMSLDELEKRYKNHRVEQKGSHAGTV